MNRICMFSPNAIVVSSAAGFGENERRSKLSEVKRQNGFGKSQRFNRRFYLVVQHYYADLDRFFLLSHKSVKLIVDKT